MLDITSQAGLVEVVIAICTCKSLSLVKVLETDHTKAVRNVTNCEALFGQLKVTGKCCRVTAIKILTRPVHIQDS